MFSCTDLFIPFYKWVFAAMLFKKVRCDPFEDLVFHCISVCFWSSVTLGINSLMQSVQCLPAHAGSVCCWSRGKNMGSSYWHQPVEKQCCKTCFSQPEQVCDTHERSHKENPDKSSCQVLNANFPCVFADLRPGHSGMFRCSHPVRICCCSKSNVKYMGTACLKAVLC